MPSAKSASAADWQNRMLKLREANATKSFEQFAKADMKRRHNVNRDLQRPDWEIAKVIQQQDVDYANVARPAAKLGFAVSDKIPYTTRGDDKLHIAQLERALAEKANEAEQLRIKLEQRDEWLMTMQDDVSVLYSELEEAKRREAQILQREQELMQKNRELVEKAKHIEMDYEEFLEVVIAETCRSCFYLTDVRRRWCDWKRSQTTPRSPTQLYMDGIEAQD